MMMSWVSSTSVTRPSLFRPRPSDRPELHVNLEVGAVLTDEGPLQAGVEPALRREDLEQVRPRHPDLDGLHARECARHPNDVVLSGCPLARLARRTSGTRTNNRDAHHRHNHQQPAIHVHLPRLPCVADSNPGTSDSIDPPEPWHLALHRTAGTLAPRTPSNRRNLGTPEPRNPVEPRNRGNPEPEPRHPPRQRVSRPFPPARPACKSPDARAPRYPPRA